MFFIVAGSTEYDHYWGWCPVRIINYEHPFPFTCWFVSCMIEIISYGDLTFTSRGDQLRIVSTTLTLGARILSARTEVRKKLENWIPDFDSLPLSQIWSLVHHRLVASGTHMKMQPSLPKHSLWMKHWNSRSRYDYSWSLHMVNWDRFTKCLSRC